MTLTLKTLETLQHAGEALHRAQLAMAQDVQSASAAMTAAILAEPLARDLDRAFALVKESARLAHELAAVEERLKAVYLAAADLVERPVRRGRQTLEGGSAQPMVALPLAVEVQDVEAKPRSARKGPGRSGGQAVAPAAKRGAVATQRPGAGLSRNEQLALVFLRRRLNRRGDTPVSNREISEAAGLPLGSVGAAVRKLVALKLVHKGERGRYRLV